MANAKQRSELNLHNAVQSPEFEYFKQTQSQPRFYPAPAMQTLHNTTLGSFAN